jgi:hypothetical protein
LGPVEGAEVRVGILAHDGEWGRCFALCSNLLRGTRGGVGYERGSANHRRDKDEKPAPLLRALAQQSAA